MLKTQRHSDFFGKPFSVLSGEDGCCVAVMRDERYTRLLAGADDLRKQLLTATILLGTLTLAVDLTEMNHILEQTGERR